MSIVLYKKIWTGTLTNGTLTITKDYNFVQVSLVLLSGTGTFSGTAIANGVASTPITMTVGQPITIGSGTSSGLDSLIITTTGVVEIIGR